jgi:serine/threonine-protein kinase HipA
VPLPTTVAPATPVWLWLPGQTEPVQAATLSTEAGGGRWRYTPEFLARADACAPDPVHLHLIRRQTGLLLPQADGLPGVLRDAKPAGYGADRLHAAAGRTLAPRELLEAGPPDGVGALEACADLERKLRWRPRPYAELRSLIADLDDHAPASRSIRHLNNDLDTSAGGERPKATLALDGQLWLVKLQDRNDRPALPAQEFVVMTLARECGIRVPALRLEQVGPHAVFLIQRFDRSGDPNQPQRLRYASAHTVLDLALAAVRGEPGRSYLALADQLRTWGAGHPDLRLHLQELWRRMAFNALAGNTDDHPHNHGLLCEAGVDGVARWGLSPAFDITPTSRQTGAATSPVLALATGADGHSTVTAQRLLDCAPHFDLPPDDAAAWLHTSVAHIAQHWAQRMRQAQVPEPAIVELAPAFQFSTLLAEQPEQIAAALDVCRSQPPRLRRSRNRR